MLVAPWPFSAGSEPKAWPGPRFERHGPALQARSLFSALGIGLSREKGGAEISGFGGPLSTLLPREGPQLICQELVKLWDNGVQRARIPSNWARSPKRSGSFQVGVDKPEFGAVRGLTTGQWLQQATGLATRPQTLM